MNSSERRLALAVTAAGFAVFALLYSPQPLLPQLAGHFGLRPGGASLAVGAATAAVAISVIPLATLAEVLGRRRVMIASVLLTVLLSAACSLAPTYPVLLTLRVLLGIAVAGLPATAMAYLGDELSGAGRGVALGALVAGNSMGGMSGRLAAGVSYQWFADWRQALAVGTGLSLLAAVTFVLALPGTTRTGKTARNARTPNSPSAGGHGAGASGAGGHGADASGAGGHGIRRGMWIALTTPPLLAQYAVAVLGMGAFVGLYNSAGFRLTSPPIELAPGIASLVFLAYATGTVTSPLAGRLAERYGRARVVLVALGSTLAGAALTLADSVPAIAVGFAVFTGGFFAAHAAASGWVSAAAPPDARGPASGIYQAAYYAGASLGGTAASVIYGLAGWPALIAVTGGWLTLAAGSVCLVARRTGGTPPTSVLSRSARNGEILPPPG